MLSKAGLHFCFVVEPQDEKRYAESGKPLMVLPSNDQGITFARHWILKQMRKMNYEKFWMLDDDIECFGYVEGGKTIQSDASVLGKAVHQLLPYGPSSMLSLELRQFAWSSPEVQKNKIAMQCVMFDLQHCQNIDYDLRFKIREDYDISFQAIFKDKGTLRSGKYYYGIADMKSQVGGMSQWYNEETEMHETWKLCRKWPGLVEPLRKDGRIDVKINWSKIK